MLKLIIGKIFLFFKARQKISAFVLYIATISLIYAPVVFLNRSLQAPLFYHNIATEEGVYGYQGRKPVNNLNVDLTYGVFADVKKFIGDVYKKGQFPLWNPYQGAGVPLPEQMGVRIFSPYQILANIAPVWTWDFFMLGRLLIAGFFTFLFLRLLSVSWLGAFLGGLFFMFSGSFIVFMQNEQMTNAAMMIPVLFWALEKLFGRPNGRNAALLAFIFALLLTAGTPGVILYALLLAAAYFAFRIITFQKTKKIKCFLLICLSFVLGLGLASPLIFLFVEFLGNTINLRAFHGLLSFNLWELLGLIISPGAAEIPTFYRITYPVNGLFDFLGGYTGILPVYLILLNCLIIPFLLKKKIRHPYFPFFCFFLGFGLFIFLKNSGLPPFAWLGYLPFFNIAWSPRWSGPIWVFCLSIAGALSFEFLKETGGQVFEAIRQSKRLKIIAVSILGLIFSVLLTGPLYFYSQSDRLLDFDSVAKTNFLTRWEVFATSWLASVLILGLAIYLTYSFVKNKNKNGLYGLFALALLELWLWVPRGYDLNSMRFKFGLFVFGLIIVGAIWKRKQLWALGTAFIFFLLFLFLDASALYGLPQRYNMFTESPYAAYLKNQDQGGYWRVMGDDSALMPNWASVFGIMDVRYIVETGAPLWFHHYRNHNLEEIAGFFGVLRHWFTGKNYKDKETELNIKHFKIKKDLCPSTSVSDLLNFVKYDQVEDKIRKQLPFYSLLGVKYILTSDSDINEGAAKDGILYFPRIYQKEINIFENPSVFPRAFIVYETEYASSWEEAQKMLRKENFDLRRRIVLEENLPPENDLGPPSDNSVSIVDYDYNKVIIKAETKTPGILVLSDVFYPGWKATLDGEPTKIYRVDGLIRGVYLPAGIHEVVFSYWPPAFANGLIAALLSFFACLVLLIFFRPEQKSKKILASIIIFLLIIPSLYFYFQSFQDFISSSKFKSESELKEQEEIKDGLNGEKYDEDWRHKEKRLAVMSYIYENIEDFTAFSDSSIKKWIPARFSFPQDSSGEVLLDLRSEAGEINKKILIYVRKIQDIFNDPIFAPEGYSKPALISDQSLKNKYSIPTPLHVHVVFDKEIRPRKIDAKVYMVLGYFEKASEGWILKAGNDLLAGKDLVSYHYDCSEFNWVKL